MKRVSKKTTSKKSNLYELLNVGPKSVEMFERAGIKSISDLKKLGPDKAFWKMEKKEKKKLHPAFLYVMRAALWYEKNRDKREMAKMWWMFRRTNEGKGRVLRVIK